jgi:hypothetical protein
MKGTKMNVTDLAKNFAEFLGKHSGELRLLGSTLQTVVDHLPIDHQDKERLSAGLSAIGNSANNIAHAANALAGEEIVVVIDKADVGAAVADFLSHNPTAAAEAEANA